MHLQSIFSTVVLRGSAGEKVNHKNYLRIHSYVEKPILQKPKSRYALEDLHGCCEQL